MRHMRRSRCQNERRHVRLRIHAARRSEMQYVRRFEKLECDSRLARQNTIFLVHLISTYHEDRRRKREVPPATKNNMIRDARCVCVHV